MYPRLPLIQLIDRRISETYDGTLYGIRIIDEDPASAKRRRRRQQQPFTIQLRRNYRIVCVPWLKLFDDRIPCAFLRQTFRPSLSRSLIDDRKTNGPRERSSRLRNATKNLQLKVTRRFVFKLVDSNDVTIK